MANSDTNTQPWHADRIVRIPFLVEKLGDESWGLKTSIVDGESFIPKSQTTHEEDCLIV